MSVHVQALFGAVLVVQVCITSGQFRLPKLTTPSGWTRPKFTSPAGTLPRFSLPQGFTRPPMTGAPSLPPVKVSYPCPKECQSCQLFKDMTKVCMAFDQYDNILQKFYNSLPQRTQDDYDFLKNTTLFRTTAYLVTCDGLMFYLKIWASLTQRQQDDFITFLKDPRRINLAQLRSFPKALFAVVDGPVERRMYSALTPDQELVMCTGLKYTDCFTRTAITRYLDCGKILLKSGTASATDISSLVDVRNCTNWDREQWNLTMKYSPEILNMECLKVAPPEVMVDNLDSLARHCQKLSSREIEILANLTISKLQDDKRKGTQISSQDKDQLADFLSFCGADPTKMGDLMDKSEMLTKVDYSKTGTKDGIKFMKEVLQTVQPRNFTKDQIVNSFKMMVYNRTLLKELDPTELESAVCEICDKADEFDEADLSKLADVVFKNVPNLRDPSNFDQATLDCIGPLLKFIPMASFDTIQPSVMRGAISSGQMKNVTVKSKSMGKKILAEAKTSLGKTNVSMKKFQTELSSLKVNKGGFTSSDLEKIGSAVVAMDATDIDNIPDNSFTDDIIDMFAENIKKSRKGDVKPSKSMVASLMKKFSTSASGVKKAIESGLGDDIPTKMLQDANLSDLPDITGDTTAVTIDVDRKRAKILMKKLKEKLGSAGGSDTNFTLSRLQNIEKIACGFSPEDIKNISRDNECVDKMNAITKSPCIEKEQVKAAQDVYREVTNFDSTSATDLESNTDSTSLSQGSPQLMAQFDYDEMKKFGTSNQDAIVSVISEAETKVLSKKQMKDGFKFIIESKGKLSSGDITKDDLDSVGNSVCGIDSSAITRLDADALEEYATKIEKCQLGATERRSLATNMMSKLDLNDGSKVDETSIMTLGTSIAEMSDTQLNAIDSTVLCEMSDKIATAFKDKETEDKERDKVFPMDNTDSDKSTYKANKKRVMKKLLESQDSCITTTSSGSSGRRRRSTTSLTCSYMRNIGTSGLSALTLDQINNLDDAQFTDCVDILGAVTDYSTDQLEALANVGKRSTVWGDPATWTATTVYSAGVIVQGLSVTEIESLTLNLDAISKLGEFDGWTDAQKQALFNRWLTLEKSNDASTITSSELRSLGHMTCGATTGHINSISHTVYSSAVDAVGEVTSCAEGQLSSFVSLAKQAYGNDVTTWDSTTISNIGTVVGGLTQSDVPNLSDSQIDSIDASHIPYIPASTFAAFTTTQINTFSVSQAQSTTSTQRSALSSSQMTALTSVANTTFSTGSGCVKIQMSLVLTTLLVFMAAFLRQ